MDPLGPLLGLVAGVIYWQNGFAGYLSRDLALYAYAGQQVADGHLPYTGVVNRAGPLAHAVPAVGAWLARLVDADELLAMRVLFLFLAAASVWVAYLLGRDLTGSRLAGLASAAALLSTHGFSEYATNGPREKTTLMLLLLGACVALARRRPGWAGALVSLATLTWQPALFVGLVAGVVAVWSLEPGRRLHGLARFVVGGLVPLLVCMASYALVGELRLFWDCFLLTHVFYTDQPGVGTDWSAVSELMQEVYGRFVWTMLVGWAALLAGAAVALLRPDPDRRGEQRVVVALAAGLVAGGAFCLRAFNGWPDVFFLLPAAFAGVALVVAAVGRRWSWRPALVLAVAWALVAGVAAVRYSLDTRGDTLDAQREETAAVMAALPADATIVSVEAPHPLVLTGRTNPFPHQMFDLGLDDYVDDTWPGGLDGLAQDIADERPTVIAVGTTDPAWLQPVLDAEYVEVGGTTGWYWYLRRSLGDEVLDEARRATGLHSGSGQ